MPLRNDYKNTNPAAPTGKQNVNWQAGDYVSDVRPVSAYMPEFVGDSGSGGVGGAVPAPAAGDAAEGKYLSANGWSVPSGIYEFPVFLLGAQTLANQILIRVRPSRAVTFPAGLVRSTFTATANATGTTVFSVQKNDVQFGTITVAAGGTSAVFVAASATSCNGTTDILSVVGPASADATLANIGIVLTGTTIIENRFAQFDEDFWINPVRPIPASIYRSPLF